MPSITGIDLDCSGSASSVSRSNGCAGESSSSKTAPPCACVKLITGPTGRAPCAMCVSNSKSPLKSIPTAPSVYASSSTNITHPWSNTPPRTTLFGMTTCKRCNTSSTSENDASASTTAPTVSPFALLFANVVHVRASSAGNAPTVARNVVVCAPGIDAAVIDTPSVVCPSPPTHARTTPPINAGDEPKSARTFAPACRTSSSPYASPDTKSCTHVADASRGSRRRHSATASATASSSAGARDIAVANAYRDDDDDGGDGDDGDDDDSMDA
mmetsp:Transcript_3305/g.11107  ORF Transcript_3305/g.11107 Transcript_3305/m.11107 type:complete len:271 (+) Transcript_3305:1515-2327(+)